MSKQVRLRRGSTAQHAVYIGPEGEVTVDTDLNSIRVHDGVTPGGHPIIGGSAVTMTVAASSALVQSLTISTDTLLIAADDNGDGGLFVRGGAGSHDGINRVVDLVGAVFTRLHIV